MPERVLGKDYVVLKNPGAVYNGATVRGDKYVHIGRLFSDGTTLCKRSMENFFLTTKDVEVDCPDCILKVTS
jgi:hypothetical protein